MATAKWSTPSTRSSNLAGTTLNSVANGSESSRVTYDNSTTRDLYGFVTIKLGSITPAAGGSITLRVTASDGTDLGDAVGGDLYTMPLTTGASAKIVNVPLARLYPFSLRFSIINNAGVALAASGNEIYVRAFNEEVN
jgi:phage tail sheath gpL-like